MKKIKNIKEGYGTGFSVSSMRSGWGGVGGMSGGTNTMYTYEIKPLNHVLEPKRNSSYYVEGSNISIGSKITGLPIRTNANPNKKQKTGIIHNIIKTPNGEIKYYVIQDEATQELIKIDPLTIGIIVHEPVEYYEENNIQFGREKKLKDAKSNKLVSESINEFLSKERK